MIHNLLDHDLLAVASSFGCVDETWPRLFQAKDCPLALHGAAWPAWGADKYYVDYRRTIRAYIATSRSRPTCVHGISLAADLVKEIVAGLD